MADRTERSPAPTESTVHRGDWYGEGDLTGARLTGATLTGCDLGAASWSRADIAKCDLRGSTLDSLDPAGVTLRGAIVDWDQAVVLARNLGLDVRA